MIQLIREFNAAIEAGKAASVLEELLEDLSNYAQIHFDTEERLLKRCHYPDLGLQETKHREYLLRVFEFKEKCELGRLNLHREVAQFLSDWWITHITSRTEGTSIL